MKFTTTSAALAVAATGAAAQDSWSAWASTSADSAEYTKDCAATVTAYKTETTTAYEHTSEVFKATVTVPVPDKPATVDVKVDWADWESTSAAATSTKSKTACHNAKTVTETSTVTSTKAGTTTVTHSTLFVGAKATGSADEAWANWNPDKDSGSDSDSTGGKGSWNGNGISGNDDNSWNGNGHGNGNGYGNDNSNGNSNNGWNHGSDDNSDDDGSNGNNGWGKGSWGGKGTAGKIIGENADVFDWNIPAVPSVISTGSAPQYTKNADGSYGGAPYGDGHWGDWTPGDDDDSEDGGKGDNGGKGGKGNGTSPDSGVIPPFGDAASNVTKPFPPFGRPGNGPNGGNGGFGGRCNDASDRSKWCDGKDTSSDYYKDYFTGRNCQYDLVLTNGTWNADGKDTQMLLVNGQFPGPAIECNWGDLVIINVHNQLENNGTTIHWHGVRQIGTNDQDGVPGVTECAVAPGQSRTYTWRASSYGTSWYHSHWNLQYGDGIQGPIVIHGPATANYDVDAGPVMITDTFPNGQTATQFGNLVAHVGPKNVTNYLLNGKNVKADLSSGQHALWKVQKGKKYLFRLINSAAQQMYSVSIDQHKLKVISADFVPIVPYETEWLNIGIGQRYDVIVEANQEVGSYHFRAVTQFACPGSSENTGLGQANGIIAYEGVSESPLLLPTSTVNGNKTIGNFATCYDEPLASLVPFLKKSAGTQSSFQSTVSTLPGGTVGRVQTTDDGSVFRWFLNNGAMYINYTEPTLKSLANDVALNNSVYANPIVLQQKDQWVYFVIQNQFFAYHPMHLHGHDFSVLGEGFGAFTADKVSTLNFDNPIRRDTAMLKGNKPGVAPPQGGYTVIGFETDNPGAWLMHCHIAWHVDGGLALQWIERPDDMEASKYTSKAEFKNECSTYAAYEAEDPAHRKTSGQSGLRKRTGTYFDKWMLEAERSAVVRRDDLAAHYLAGHKKRSLGDGARRLGQHA